MLEIQKWFKEGRTPEELEEAFGITIKWHKSIPELAGFYYNQLHPANDFSQKIVRECRGIILNMTDYSVVSHPFDKFFNMGETHAAEIDWNSAVVQEKVDGSLMTLYWYEDNWHVASNGTPDAFGMVNDQIFTFMDLFWDVWDELEYEYPEDINCCYMFELMTPFNQIVVRQEKRRLVFLGGRNIKTQIEISPMAGLNFNWEIIGQIPFFGIESLNRQLEEMKGVEQEGFVVRDRNYNRLKLKCPDYIRLHRLAGNGPMTYRRILELFLLGEIEEVLTYFPVYTDTVNKVKTDFSLFINEVHLEWDKYKNIEDKKEFALAVKDLPIASFLFALKNGKAVTVQEALLKLPLNSIEKYIRK